MSPDWTRDPQDQALRDVLPTGSLCSPTPVSPGGPCSRSLKQGHLGTDPHQLGLRHRQDGALWATQNFSLVPKTTS